MHDVDASEARERLNKAARGEPYQYFQALTDVTVRSEDLRTLLAAHDARGEALRKCEEQFDHYVELHLAKEPPDYQKADTNKAMADEIRRALAGSPPGSGVI